MFWKRVVSLMAVGLTAVLVSACGSGTESSGTTSGATTRASSASATESATASGPLTFPVLGIYSGPFKLLGTSQRRGVTLALDEINKEGGLLGRKLVAEYANDGGSPTQAVSQARALIQKLKAPVFFGPSISTSSQAVDPIANEAKVILFPGSAAANTVNASKYPYTFRAYLTEVSESAALVAYCKKHNTKRVAVLAETGAYGEATEAAVVQGLKANNITVTGTESFTAGTPDLTPVALKLKAGRPEIVYMVASGTGDFADFVQAEQSIGLSAPMLGAPAITTPEFKSLAKGAGENTLGQVYRTLTYTSSGPVDPEMPTFIKRIDKLGGSGDLLTVDMYFYDMVHLWATAVKKANSFEPEAVKTALEGIKDYKGIQGTFNFSPTQHDGLSLDSLTTAKVAGSSLKEGLWQLAE